MKESNCFILFPWKYGNFIPLSQLHNFLYRHRRYVHPETVLARDDATLHGVTPTHAWFCVSKHDVYDPETFPFTFLLQFLQSHQLVIMPHEAFHRLADSVGDPTVRFRVVVLLLLLLQ